VTITRLIPVLKTSGIGADLWHYFWGRFPRKTLVTWAQARNQLGAPGGWRVFWEVPIFF